MLIGDGIDGYYDLEDNLIRKNTDYFSYDGKNQLLSASIAGEEGSTVFELTGTEDFTRLGVEPDILGEEKLVTLTGDDLSLDWGSRSLGIDLGYGYKVSQVVLKPEGGSLGRTPEEKIKDRFKVYGSLYNQTEEYEELSFIPLWNGETGELTLTLTTENVFVRYIKIHSHYNELDEQGNLLDSQKSLYLSQEKPFGVSVISSGRNEFYTYDLRGNRTAFGLMTNGITRYDYAYYRNSDLIKTVTGDGKTTAYKYDDNGNMIERGSQFTQSGDEITILPAGEDYRRFEYDLLNRLIAAYGPEETAPIKTYAYNVNGLRVLSQEGNVRTYYTFDLSGQMIEKEVENTSVRSYIYLGSKVVAMKEEGEVYYYGTDHLGSTILMTDSQGSQVWAGAVTPFGDSETTSGLDEKVLYTGKEMDEATGLYYFNARWYDASLGRFISEDPARDGAHWYVYVRNNPLRWIDPTGLTPEVWEDFMTYSDADMGTEETGHVEFETLKEFATFMEIEIYHEDDPTLQEKYGDVIEQGTKGVTSSPLPLELMDASDDESWPGPRRSLSTPQGNTQEGHSGVDISAPQGTPVFAARDGVITSPHPNADFGNNVRVDHGRVISLSAHLMDGPKLPNGSIVHSGAPLGRVGSTGLSTGPHLHYGLYNRQTGRVMLEGTKKIFSGAASFTPEER